MDKDNLLEEVREIFKGISGKALKTVFIECEKRLPKLNICRREVRRVDQKLSHNRGSAGASMLTSNGTPDRDNHRRRRFADHHCRLRVMIN
jgi:hypothetical protein